MLREIKVPAFPESVSDGTIVTWHKNAGDIVKRDENIVDIETDKVMFEVPAPADGCLSEILVNVGDTVVSGQVLAKIDDSRAAEAGSAGAVAQTQPTELPATGMVEPVDHGIVTPAARRIMSERGIDATEVRASGKGGRILKEDVLRVLDTGAQEAPAKTASKTETKKASTQDRTQKPSPVIEFPSHGARPEKRVPMTRLRARIAERLVDAQRTAAILTTFNEVNMQPVMDLRGKYRERFEKEYGVKLGFMSFFVRAVVEALKDFPVLNASVDDNDIVYHGFYDIGVAVASPRGLVVPILRDADQAGMAEIEARVLEFGKKAKEGSLSIDEITGGTFTITNGGVFGSLMSTPILNPPQSGILGMHKIQERPVAENGQVVIRPMMYLALSYDHRIVDGREAVQFLVTIKDLLEDPARMLLEI